jgi:DNA-binding NtrC family response regulator
MSAAHILVVDDEPDIRDLLCEILADEGYAVTAAADADAARKAQLEHHPDLALLDIWMPDVDGITLLHEWHAGEAPDFPVIMMSGHATIETAVEATRLGAHDFVEKPLSLSRLLLTVREALASAPERGADRPRGRPQRRLELVGTSRALVALRERIACLAASDVPLLVSGEPGSGKHTAAGLLHQQSARAARPLVELDLGTVAAGETGAALFASDGAWARAGEGTLVVHDIAELDAPTQARLSERLDAGAAARAPRLVALTAEDLPALVAAHRFRSDLYHALNGAALHVPALRAHAEDLPELLAHWVNRLVEDEGLVYRHFTVPAQNRLRQYDWPGNVDEVASLVRRLLLLGDTTEIDADAVTAALAELRTCVEVPATAMALPLDQPLREAREQFERAYLQHQLRAVGGRMGDLARRVGMERTHLYRKLKSLGVDHGTRERG